MLWWLYHNVVARSRREISNDVKIALSRVVKTLPQRCYNVATTLSIWFLDHFITDNSDLFSQLRNMRKLQKYLSIEYSLWQARRTLVNSWLCLLLVCEQDRVAKLGAVVAMKGLVRGKKRLQHNIVDLFPNISTVLDRWSLHGEWTWNTYTKALSGIKHISFAFKRTLYLWLTKLCTNHAKYIKINSFTITAIIHYFT